MREKVEKVLEEIRPYLKIEGGDVELVDIDAEGVVKLRLKGSCGYCPMSTYTLKFWIEKMLKEKIPEVKRVEQVF